MYNKPTTHGQKIESFFLFVNIKFPNVPRVWNKVYEHWIMLRIRTLISINNAVFG